MKSAILLVQTMLIVSLLWGAIESQSAPSAPKPELPETVFDYRNPFLSDFLKSDSRAAGALHHNRHYLEQPNLNNIATLGRVLFYDRQLSANGLVSCASCHKQNNGFDDPSRFSIGFQGRITKRNGMGLANAAFNTNNRYFWDERADGLKDQVMQPFFDPIEMGLKRGELLQRVNALEYYKTLFQKAFGEREIANKDIAHALATFVSSLVSVDSKFDRARIQAKGPTARFRSFSQLENQGKRIFFSRPEQGGGNCFTCHQTEVFISPAGGSNNGLDAENSVDAGIGGSNSKTRDYGKFRAPSLRNIAVRSTYMHDGRFDSLEKVVNHYSTGIKNNPALGNFLRNENGTPRRFFFSEIEKRALLAFLNTLTDEKFLRDPKFSNPFKPTNVTPKK